MHSIREDEVDILTMHALSQQADQDGQNICYKALKVKICFSKAACLPVLTIVCGLLVHKSGLLLA